MSLTDEEQLEHTRKLSEALAFHKSSFFTNIENIARKSFDAWAKKGICLAVNQ